MKCALARLFDFLYFVFPQSLCLCLCPCLQKCLTWHMNCSFSRLSRGTMLVLLVPASSHITDSRSITLALKKRRELFRRGGRDVNICVKCKTRVSWTCVYLPVSAVLVFTLWSHSIEQLQNHGFPPSKNSAVRSEGDKYAFFIKTNTILNLDKYKQERCCQI